MGSVVTRRGIFGGSVLQLPYVVHSAIGLLRDSYRLIVCHFSLFSAFNYMMHISSTRYWRIKVCKI